MSTPLKVLTGAFVATRASGMIWEKWKNMTEIEDNAIKRQIKNIYAAAKNAVLDAYDEAMEKIEERLRSNLEVDYGLNSDSIAKHNAKVQVEKILNDIIDIRKEIKSNGTFGYIF